MADSNPPPGLSTWGQNEWKRIIKEQSEQTSASDPLEYFKVRASAQSEQTSASDFLEYFRVSANSSPVNEKPSGFSSILDELFSVAGNVAGNVLGDTLRVAGELVDSSFLKEVGDSVQQLTSKTGETLGKAAASAWDIATGTVTGDESQVDQGLDRLGEVVEKTADGVVNGVKNVAKHGSDVIEGLLNDDKDQANQGLRNLAKVAATSFVAISVADFIGDFVSDDSPFIHEGADGAEHDSTESHNNTSEITDRTVENLNTHHVDPFPRHNPDGSMTMVGEDTGGWEQTNPNYKAK